MASKKKPLILSTGMASLSEIEEAVRMAIQSGSPEVTLLKCTSSYPAPINEANLLTIPHLKTAFNLPVGISDHTPGILVPIVAVGL